MQHYDGQNLHKIRDAQPSSLATVRANDVSTLAELMRRGFHLIDMSGEVWTLRRAGEGRDREN